MNELWASPSSTNWMLIARDRFEYLYPDIRIVSEVASWLHWDNAPFFRITRYSDKPLLLRFRRVIFQLPQPLIRRVLQLIQRVCPSALSQPPVPWLWQRGSALLVWHFHIGLPSSSGFKNIEPAFDPYSTGIVRDSEEPTFTLQDLVAMGRSLENEASD